MGFTTGAPGQGGFLRASEVIVRGDLVQADRGSVTQATNKSTGVTLNNRSGAITRDNAALAAAAEVTFIVTNSTVVATDVVILSIQTTGATAGAYTAEVNEVGAGVFSVTVSNASAGSLSEAVIINFVVIATI